MATANRYTGLYEDTSEAAVNQVLEAVKLPVGDFILCQYADGFTYVPVDPEGPWSYDLEIFYSKVREQYKATIIRIPNRISEG